MSQFPPGAPENDPFHNAKGRPLVPTDDKGRLRLAIDAGRMALWAVDETGNVEVSPEFNRLLRLPEDRQPSLQELLDRYYPGEYERVQALVESAIVQGERFVEWEYRHLWPDDEVRWLLVRAEFLRKPDGTPGGSLGVIMDITERKQSDERREKAEAELRESEMRLRIAQAAGRIGSFEIFPDQQRIRVSEEFCRIWGLPALEDAPIGHFLDFVLPEDLAKLDSWRTKQPAGGLDYVEFRIRRPDTTEVRWMALRGEAIRDHDSGTVRYVGISYDITDRVLFEQRQKFLLDFSDEMRRIAAPSDIIRRAQAMLGERLEANRVGYGEVDSSERYFTTIDNWTNKVPSRHGTHDLADFGPEIHSALTRGEPVSVDDVRTDPRTNHPAFVAAFEAIDTCAAITASLVIGGKMVAALYVHSREPRKWAKSEVQLVQDVAERTWTELARARAEAQARASEERYRRIFEQTKDPIITADLDQVITDANPAAAEAVGVERKDVIGRRIADFIPPEDYERSSAMLQDKIERGGTTRYDVRVRSASGDFLFWEINSGLSHDEAGRPIGLHVVARDVTERKRWERHQALLVAELNHRVKNTLAVVQSLAHQTFRRGANAPESIAAYEGRLNALAAAHNLLTRENWESADLHELVEQALRPFCSAYRCSVQGPDSRIGPRIAVSLTLALHELATNSVKYGALSSEAGQLIIEWNRNADGLRIFWKETGGPRVTKPKHSGFGTRMLQRALAQDVGGAVDLNFEEGGLTCEIVISDPTAG